MLILEFLRLFSLHHSQVDDGGDEEEDGGEVALPDDLRTSVVLSVSLKKVIDSV